MRFGENLKYLRERKKLNQSDFEEIMGIKQTTWNNYERGNSYPKLLDFIQISKYFDITESDLLHKNLKENLISEPKMDYPIEKTNKKDAERFKKAMYWFEEMVNELRQDKKRLISDIEYYSRCVRA